MKKIYIDCGVFTGNTIDPYYDDYVVYGFEPNPNKFDKLVKKYEKATLYNKAVWVNDGKMGFHLTVRNESCSLFERKDEKEIVTVESINFNKWIKETFNEDDYIIIKMDIEGAEYTVLNDMLDNGSMKYVNEIFIEFHNRVFNPKPSRAVNNLLRKRISELGIEVKSWK